MTQAGIQSGDAMMIKEPGGVCIQRLSGLKLALISPLIARQAM
jgi:hypothetical protein